MTESSAGLIDFLMTIPWYAWVAIVAILSGCITGLVSGARQHRERLEMIRQGMHPDHPAGKVGHPEL